MAILKYDEAPAEQFRSGAERRLGHMDNLMMVIIDFHDGPTEQPDPPHAHPHEQVSYVAEGETRLGPGDMFLVPPGRPHSIQQLTEHVRLVDCFTPIREDFLK
jgi:quercetin dioxygenase-like cupin family protein